MKNWTEKRFMEELLEKVQELKTDNKEIEAKLAACAAGPWRPLREEDKDGRELIFKMKTGDTGFGRWSHDCWYIFCLNRYDKENWVDLDNEIIEVAEIRRQE